MKITKERVEEAKKKLNDLSDGMSSNDRTRLSGYLIYFDEFLKDALLSSPTQQSVDQDRNRKRKVK